MSININNFSIANQEFIYCSTLVDFSVDVTDTSRPITTSGTYFKVNGVQVATNLNIIPNGYRLTYITVPSGNIDLVVRGNTSNSTVTKTYELQYGYEVLWNEVNFWDNKEEVPVFISATNTASDSNTEVFSTFFKTKDYSSLSLVANISAEGSGKEDLRAFIRPQSKWFFYGKTYSVTISGVKDFSGNALVPQTFTFSIESNE